MSMSPQYIIYLITNIFLGGCVLQEMDGRLVKMMRKEHAVIWSLSKRPDLEMGELRRQRFLCDEK